jgi:hypothetical protein
MKVSIDIHFGYGAALAAGTSGGLLGGLYANEAISIPFFIGSTAAYVGFHFAAMWVNRADLNYRADAMVRAQRHDEYRQGIIDRARNPIELEPMDVQLSSLRRAG